MTNTIITSTDIENEYNAVKINTKTDLIKYNIRGFYYENNDDYFKNFFTLVKNVDSLPKYGVGLYIDDRFNDFILKNNIRIFYETIYCTDNNEKIYSKTLVKLNNAYIDNQLFNIDRFVNYLYILTKSKKDKAKIKLIL